MSVYGNQVGMSASHVLGFYGANPVVQPSSSSQAAVTTSVTTTVTTANLASTVADIITLVNQMRSDFVTLGLLKGSA